MVLGWQQDVRSPKVAFRKATASNASEFTVVSVSDSCNQYHYGGFTSDCIHFAELVGLEEDTEYEYKMSTGLLGGDKWTDLIRFRSHPGTGPLVESRLIVIGDMGQTTNSRGVLHGMLRNAQTAQAMHIVGDLSYADHQQPRWGSWMSLMEPLSAALPSMVTPGNHELEPDAQGRPFVAFNALFRMPQGAGSRGNLYYSYDLGSMHILSLCPWLPYRPGSAQYEYARRDLAAVDHGRTPFIVVMIHYPLENSNSAHQPGEELPRVRELLEPLFLENHVDFVLAGHVHAYERHWPCTMRHRREDGPIYITVGDGGNRERLYSSWIDPIPACSAFRATQYGHATLVANGTHAAWEWHVAPNRLLSFYMSNPDVLPGTPAAAAGTLGMQETVVMDRVVRRARWELNLTDSGQATEPGPSLHGDTITTTLDGHSSQLEQSLLQAIGGGVAVGLALAASLLLATRGCAQAQRQRFLDDVADAAETVVDERRERQRRERRRRGPQELRGPQGAPCGVDLAGLEEGKACGERALSDTG